MNLKSRLMHLSDKSSQLRQYGKTSAIAKVCLELQGVMIAASHDEARDLHRKFGVVAKSYEINLDDLSGPFFFDHHALEVVLTKAANKIAILEHEALHKDEKIRNLEMFIDSQITRKTKGDNNEQR